MTVSEFMQKHGVSRRTVYYWIESGEIEARKIGGKWLISDDGDVIQHDTTGHQTNQIELDLQQRIEEMRDEIEYLQQELSQANQTIAQAQQTIGEVQQRYDDVQQRHDEAQQQSNMIVMQLTKQLENHQLMLEDMRGRSLWKRVKTALGFAAS